MPGLPLWGDNRPSSVGQKPRFAKRSSAIIVKFRKLEMMKIDAQRVSRYANYAAVIFLAAVGAFLSTSPLHPQVGDSHGGLMGVFPGAFLLLFASLLYVAGRFLNRQKKWGWLVQLSVSVVAVVTLVIQILG